MKDVCDWPPKCFGLCAVQDEFPADFGQLSNIRCQAKISFKNSTGYCPKYFDKQKRAEDSPLAVQPVEGQSHSGSVLKPACCSMLQCAHPVFYLKGKQTFFKSGNCANEQDPSAVLRTRWIFPHWLDWVETQIYNSEKR